VEADLDPVLFAEAEQAAWEYARRHFSNSKVESVEFVNAVYTFLGVEVKDDGTVLFNYQSYWFNFTDDTGREGFMFIVSGINEMSLLQTSHSDIIPGYDAYVPGSVG
jgi:hypothetical protein